MADDPVAGHTVVDAPPAVAWAAAGGLDFLTVHTPLLDAATWLRGVLERVAGRAARVPPRLVLTEDGCGLPGWIVLDAAEPREVAFGAVGAVRRPHHAGHGPHDRRARRAATGAGRDARSGGRRAAPYGPGAATA